MKNCFVRCLLVLPLVLVVDSQLTESVPAVDERMARVNQELRSTWGRGSAGRWAPPKVMYTSDPTYDVRELTPAAAKSVNPLPMGQCGTVSGTKIVNGKEAGLNEFPWLALLRFRDEVWCGGSLITSEYVLTAAHCVEIIQDRCDLKQLKVVLGEHDLTKDPDCDDNNNCIYTKTEGVRKIISHERYRPNRYGHDIALLRLTESILLGGSIIPICLPFYAESAAVNNADSFLIAGWGLTENGTGANVLRVVDVAPVGVAQCVTHHRGANATMHICAGGTDGKDSCNGDSGGPLMAVGDVQGSQLYILAGVLSVGQEDCLKFEVPAVYEKVTYFMGWILDNITP